MDRRDFLLKSAYASGLVLASQTLPGWLGTAFAQSLPMPADDHFLLILRVNGAWDVTFGMDARVPTELKNKGIDDDDFFFMYKDEEIIKAGEATLAPPAAALVKHIDDIAIVNGVMMMSQNTVHEQNRAYMVSGSVNAADGAFPFQLASVLGDAPLGVAQQYEYEQIQTGGYPSMIRIDQLLSAQAMSQSETDEILKARVAQALKVNGRKNNRALLNSQMTAVESNEKIRKMNELAAQFKTNIPAGNAKLEAVSNVLAAFAAGTVRYAVYDFQADGSLDTHSDHANRHPVGLKEAMDNVASVIELLKATNMFDKTTVVVMSEFARSPWKENGTGTGHNPLCNSTLLFGRGIQGGRVIGSSRVWSRKQTAESRSRLQANLFDFITGKSVTDDVLAQAVKGTIKVGSCTVGSGDACVDYIYPESIWKTVAQGFGLARGTKPVESALAIPGLLKKS